MKKYLHQFRACPAQLENHENFPLQELQFPTYFPVARQETKTHNRGENQVYGIARKCSA